MPVAFFALPRVRTAFFLGKNLGLQNVLTSFKDEEYI